VIRAASRLRVIIAWQAGAALPGIGICISTALSMSRPGWNVGRSCGATMTPTVQVR